MSSTVNEVIPGSKWSVNSTKMLIDVYEQYGNNKDGKTNVAKNRRIKCTPENEDFGKQL